MSAMGAPRNFRQKCLHLLNQASNNWKEKSAWDYALDGGASERSLVEILESIFGEGGVKAKQDMLRATATKVERFNGRLKTFLKIATEQVPAVDRNIRGCFHPSMMDVIATNEPLEMLQVLGRYVRWYESMISTFRRQASKKATGGGTLQWRNSCITLLVIYLEQVTGGIVASEQIAKLVEIAAKVSGTKNVPREISDSWIRGIVADYRKEFSRNIPAIEAKAAQFVVNDIRMAKGPRALSQLLRERLLDVKLAIDSRHVDAIRASVTRMLEQARSEGLWPRSGRKSTS